MDPANQPTAEQLHPDNNNVAEFNKDEEINNDNDFDNDEDIAGDKEVEEEDEDNCEQLTASAGVSCPEQGGQLNEAQAECLKLLHKWRSNLLMKRRLEGMGGVMKGKITAEDVLAEAVAMQIATTLPRTAEELGQCLGTSVVSRKNRAGILSCVYQATNTFSNAEPTSQQEQLDQHEERPKPQQKPPQQQLQQQECRRLLNSWVRKMVYSQNLTAKKVLCDANQKAIAEALPQTEACVLACCGNLLSGFARSNMADILQCVSRAIETYPEGQPQLSKRQRKEKQKQYYQEQGCSSQSQHEPQYNQQPRRFNQYNQHTRHFNQQRKQQRRRYNQQLQQNQGHYNQLSQKQQRQYNQQPQQQRQQHCNQQYQQQQQRNQQDEQSNNQQPLQQQGQYN